MTQDLIKNAYSNAANGVGCGCGCGDSNKTAKKLGYSDEELDFLPDGSNLGLGCGNPISFANLQNGETVLDLGSGAGIDCFLASKEVGANGFVYGVDMTEAMIEKANKNASLHKIKNVEFRLGYIENLPIDSSSIDVVISNCVVNLSLDKKQLFAEIFRVLKKGGRVAISDIATTAKLPDNLLKDENLFTSCVSGASDIQTLKNLLIMAGFINVSIEPKDNSKEFLQEWVDGIGVENYIASVIIKTTKP